MNTKQTQLISSGNAIEYRSYAPTTDGGRWTWRGRVLSVTNKYAMVEWTHSNRPVFGGPITEDEKPIVKRLHRRLERNLVASGGTFTILCK